MFPQILISGVYNAFDDGYNGAGVYMASGLFQSRTFERPIYIGSSEGLKKRIIREHLADLAKPEWIEGKMRTNLPLYRAWKSHGSDSFVWFLLEPCAPEDTLVREQFYLDLHRPFCDEKRGYNIAHNASASMKGRKHTEAACQKIRVNHARYMKGKKHTSETKQKMSRAAIGNKRCLGKKMPPISDATRKKLSDASKRNQNRHKVTPPIKSYSFTSPQGQVFEGSNINAFARTHSLCSSTLSAVLRGVVSQHKGWRKTV